MRFIADRSIQYRRSSQTSDVCMTKVFIVILTTKETFTELLENGKPENKSLA